MKALKVIYHPGGNGNLFATVQDALDSLGASVSMFGAVGDGVTNDATAINNAITTVSAAGGGPLYFPPGTYSIGSTVISRQNVICRAQFGTVIIKLATNANCNIVDSYDFDNMYADQDNDFVDNADFTQDYGWEGFIFHGNWDNQSTSSLIYGMRLYGRRLHLVDCIIHDVKGVGLWTAGALNGPFNGDYDYTKGATPSLIDRVEIMNTLDEGWIYEGMADTEIGHVVVNAVGDPDNNGTTPQVSRHDAGGPVNALTWKHWGSMQHLNLNGARFGYCLYVESGNRVNIDNLIVSGGWGNAYFESNCFGVIDKLLSQTNPYSWSSNAKPHIEVLTDDIIFNAVTIRRIDGSDNEGVGIKDSGGCSWGKIRCRTTPNATIQPGTLFQADATNIKIDELNADTVELGLHTTTNCERIDFSAVMDTCTVFWQNDKADISGDWRISGTVGTGNTVESTVTTGGTHASYQSIAKGQYAFLDSSTIAGSSGRSMLPIEESLFTAASTTSIGGHIRSPDVKVSGNTGITSFGEGVLGARRRLRFTGTPLLTHNATSMILPNNGNDIQVAAGDTLEALCLGSSNWLVYNFTRASGGPVALGRGAPVTKTANFTVAATENHLINNKSGSSCTVTLPSASGFTGREIMIKTIQAQTVVSASSNVVPRAGGAAGTAILAANAGDWALLVSNGTNWEIMAGTP